MCMCVLLCLNARAGWMFFFFKLVLPLNSVVNLCVNSASTRSGVCEGEFHCERKKDLEKHRTRVTITSMSLANLGFYLKFLSEIDI